MTNISKQASLAGYAELTTCAVSGTPVRVGDSVGFKSDFEQYGRIVAILLRNGRAYLQLEGNFSGHYLAGCTHTIEAAADCWID